MVLSSPSLLSVGSAPGLRVIIFGGRRGCWVGGDRNSEHESYHRLTLNVKSFFSNGPS